MVKVSYFGPNPCNLHKALLLTSISLLIEAKSIKMDLNLIKYSNKDESPFI